MMVHEGFESARDNFDKFIYQFQPKTKALVRKFETVLIGLHRQCVFSILSNLLKWRTAAQPHTHTHTHTHTHIYIYIYIYIRWGYLSVRTAVKSISIATTWKGGIVVLATYAHTFIWEILKLFFMFAHFVSDITRRDCRILFLIFLFDMNMCWMRQQRSTLRKDSYWL